MDSTVIAVAAGALLLWSLFSARLGRWDVSGPMAMGALGALADATGLVDISVFDSQVGVLASAALALILFSDAARINMARLARHVGLPGRMLGIGLPLTLLAGTVAAYLMLDGIGWGGALLVAACLAPTDAALGSAIVTLPAVPRPIRRALNVESGLNDGIASPFVTLAVAIVIGTETDVSSFVPEALTDLGLGLVVGSAVGAGGGALMRTAGRRGWAQRDVLPLAALGLAVLSYTGSLALGGNGFISAFVAGLAFAPAGRGLDAADGEASVAPIALSELGGQVLGTFVWFLFGAALLGPVLENLTPAYALYAVASLTVIRMVPVALALAGSGTPGWTVAFVGWFGPRGLASLVFVIEAVDEIPVGSEAVLSVVGFTVLLSVIAHGVTAMPLADRYGDWCERTERHPADGGVEPVARHWMRRARHAHVPVEAR